MAWERRLVAHHVETCRIAQEALAEYDQWQPAA
jgi:hypothetical protein